MQLNPAGFEADATRKQRVYTALQRLRAAPRGIISLDFLQPAELAALRAECGTVDFRRATAEIAYKGRRVHQDFDVCFPAPRRGAFAGLADCLETCVQDATSRLSVLPDGIRFNDFAIQRYPAGSRGIGVHRDGKRYHGIVVIVTLDGESRLVSCADRAGSAKRRIDDRPGRVVLLTATEFDGRSDEAVRPLHMVDKVHGGRLSIGFRYEPSVTQS